MAAIVRALLSLLRHTGNTAQPDTTAAQAARSADVAADPQAHSPPPWTVANIVQLLTAMDDAASKNKPEMLNDLQAEYTDMCARVAACQSLANSLGEQAVELLPIGSMVFVDCWPADTELIRGLHPPLDQLGRVYAAVWPYVHITTMPITERLWMQLDGMCRVHTCTSHDMLCLHEDRLDRT
jgi:hypothetical protein